MEEEMTTTPEPLRAVGTLHGGLIGSSSATGALGPLPKPPWHRRLKDRNLEVAKAWFKVVQVAAKIGSAIGGWKTIWDALELFLGRERQPAQR